MAAPELQWHGLTLGNVKKYVGKGKLFLGASDSKVYAGRVNEVNDRYVELQNGADRQFVYHSQRLIRFAVFDPPEGFDLKMGNPELDLSVDS